MSKQFLAIIAVVIVLLGGVFVITNKNSGTSGSSSSAKPSSHVEGSTSSGVKLVEYGDYECPYCGQYYPIVKQAVEQYKDKIQFQFRNLPLSSIHKNAFAGARAAEAASLQGKFWEMHDKLYENQDPQGASGWVASNDPLNDYFVNFARQIGLDTTKFKTDFASSTVNDTINADIAEFKKTKLDESTPTFLLDGKHITPGYSLSDFTKAFDAAISAQAKGTAN
ncbi:MAG TPA: thioredoxin domain-containing protein [Candidatus Microsaccharimonas sp.]|nr:thioredoxin domain-containing protein [Candidatus Microsaccharimonas sp.]